LWKIQDTVGHPFHSQWTMASYFCSNI
jgi:hypothetical protein